MAEQVKDIAAQKEIKDSNELNDFNGESAAATEGGKNAVILFVDKNIPELAEKSDEEKLAAAAQLLEQQVAFNAKMSELFEKDPAAGALLAAVLKGDKSLPDAIAEVITPEELEALITNEGGSAQEAMNKRRATLQEYDSKAKLIAENGDKSAQNLDAWAEKKGLDEAKTGEFANNINELMKILADGVITDKEFDQLYNMFHFDEAIGAAREEGAIAGRNEKIDAKRVEKEARTVTDGLPKLAGGGAPAGGEAPAKPHYFEETIAAEKARQEKLRGV